MGVGGLSRGKGPVPAGRARGHPRPPNGGGGEGFAPEGRAPGESPPGTPGGVDRWTEEDTAGRQRVQGPHPCPPPRRGGSAFLGPGVVQGWEGGAGPGAAQGAPRGSYSLRGPGQGRGPGPTVAHKVPARTGRGEAGGAGRRCGTGRRPRTSEPKLCFSLALGLFPAQTERTKPPSASAPALTHLRTSVLLSGSPAASPAANLRDRMAREARHPAAASRTAQPRSSPQPPAASPRAWGRPRPSAAVSPERGQDRPRRSPAAD